MDTTDGSFYPSSPERRAQAALADAQAASSAAVVDTGLLVLPYGPVPRGQPQRLGPITGGALVVAGEAQPSAVHGVQRRLFEAEAEKDSLRIQLSSVVAQFRARENWWRLNVTESKNQVIAGVFQNHQFELEARQQWEQRLRNVESLVDEAITYTGDQHSILHARSEQVVALEAQLANVHTTATGEVARLSQRVLEEGQAISRYRGEVYSLREAGRNAENQVALAHGSASASVAELRDKLQVETKMRLGLEQLNRELIGRTETQESELVHIRTYELVKRDTRVGTLTQELNVLRADYSTVTAELRSADSTRESTVSLRTKLAESETKGIKEAERARTYEAEFRASRYDCDRLQVELKEWEEQASEQHQEEDWYAHDDDQDADEESLNPPTFGRLSAGRSFASAASGGGGRPPCRLRAQDGTGKLRHQYPSGQPQG